MVYRSCSDWSECAPGSLTGRRLFHTDGVSRQRPVVRTGSRPGADLDFLADSDA